MADYTLPFGNVARVPVEFTNELTGAFIDPPQVRVKVRTPQQKIKTYVFPTASEIVKDAVGKYRIDIPLIEPGEYLVEWEGRNPPLPVTAYKVSIMSVRSEFYTRTGVEIPDS